jgi:hypothetical protein
MSRALKLLLGLTLLAQAGVAQSQAPSPQPAPTPAPNVDIPVRQRSVLSSQDMINQSTDYRTRMEQTLKQVQGLAEQARKQKDVIRLNCVLDKLAQLKANVTIADSAIQSLREATARRDEGASVHEYTRVTIVNQKAQVLGAEAQACVGEDLAYVGATRVDVEIDGIPPGDPTQPWPVHPTNDRPPLASPFL